MIAPLDSEPSGSIKLPAHARLYCNQCKAWKSPREIEIINTERVSSWVQTLTFECGACGSLQEAKIAGG